MPISILAINDVGLESGMAFLVSTDSIPWVQDTPAAGVWSAWCITDERYRDVVVLDGQNRVITSYNLTQHSLSDPANYNALKAILRDAATP